MERNSGEYGLYLSVLREELIPAMGCTEPIAIALAAARAREVLGELPDEITAACSGNVIKNVKGVVVPGTGNLRGIETSAVLGAVGGDAQRQLEVLSAVTPDHVEQTKALLEKGICRVEILRGSTGLHIVVTAKKGGRTALVEIHGHHTNIVRIEKDGEVLYEREKGETPQADTADRGRMSVEGIHDFANSVDLEDVRTLLDTQIEYNTRIAEEGLRHSYGANVGATLLQSCGDDVRVRARAWAAAGSDARMSGCVLPVIINSGSGNQGLTASLPVIKYAEHLGSPREKLYRALCMSNLTAIHQKTGIGRLSAYCGAVSAACGSGAGIAYLQDAGLDVIGKTIVNTLANVSGIVCDGAKASCAAKIASAVDAALLGLNMAERGQTFGVGEGIVKSTVEDTLRSVGRLASRGMRETDTEILEIMVEESNKFGD